MVTKEEQKIRAIVEVTKGQGVVSTKKIHTLRPSFSERQLFNTLAVMECMKIGISVDGLTWEMMPITSAVCAICGNVDECPMARESFPDLFKS